jgi:hypothetical protein
MRKVTNTRIEGFNEVMRNLNKEIMKIEGRTMQGLIGAAAYIRVDMDHTQPLIPIKTGVLRSSWFITPYKVTKKTIRLTMGFSANYAVYVHEMVGKVGEGIESYLEAASGDFSGFKTINWSRPGSGPKFFEAAIKRNVNVILGIIKATVQIKG